MTPSKQTPSGEGEESPHRSASGDDDDEPVGLNDFFATHANGHHEPNPMDL